MPFEHSALGWAHPVVRDWFLNRFGSPTEPQEQGWPHILAGRTTLIAAPTGSGKTFSAFLACIDRLVRKALAGDLQDRTEVLYISPLKALGNDIQRNLEAPLGEILQLAAERGLLMPEIRTAVRTGDTLMHERRAMLKRPPHILVTTPESLYILLTAERSRAVLRDVDTVIVDEIHAVAGDKRGAHLALSLERLDALVGKRPVRIGLSATQKPIEQIAEFLTGSGRPAPAIVDIGHKRQLDLKIEVPNSELGPVASNEMWDEMYDRIADMVRQHRSTLVFVNTRRMAERMAHHLAERLGEDVVGAHHGSLARKIRLTAERRLKAGELRVLVATASLQLGIDIGTVDLVCQMGTPRSIAVALQRIGRAGHWRGAIPKGRIFATTLDELLECAALVRAIRHGELDRILIPQAPLDVLAQQIVAACAAEEWSEDEMFAMAHAAYPYRDLPRADFEAVLEMLSEGISARRGRYGAYLHRDRVQNRLRARRGARLAAITSGGAIPETALYTVVAAPEGTIVGTVDEDFAVESLAGDIMLLGNTSWRIRRVESAAGRLLVEDAHGSPPNIPFWRGEAPSRTAELSEQVAELRREISDRLPGVSPIRFSPATSEISETVAWLKEECGLDDAAAEQAIQHVVTGRAVLGDVPTQQTIIAERFFDEGGGMQLVIHAPFGGRVNKAWGLALRKRFCRSFNFELQAAATDDGVNIALAEQHSFPLADVFHYLQPESVQQVLEQAVLTGSPIFGTRFRWDAMRSLALLRFQGGKKIPLPIQRIRSDDLLATVFPDVAACQENIEGDIQIPDHPLVKEVMKDVLTEAMDIDGLRQVLRGIEDGSIRCLAVDTPIPSVFSHEILNANPYAYLDDAPLEERRARAVEMRRVLPESVLQEVGRLDPAAIALVQQEAWPDIRDADELHDVLQTLIALPVNHPSEGHDFSRAGAPSFAAFAKGGNDTAQPETHVGTGVSPVQPPRSSGSVTGHDFSRADHSPSPNLVTGHDFSRADHAHQEGGALAPVGAPSFAAFAKGGNDAVEAQGFSPADQPFKLNPVIPSGFSREGSVFETKPGAPSFAAFAKGGNDQTSPNETPAKAQPASGHDFSRAETILNNSGALAPDSWRQYFDELARARRAAVARHGLHRFWVNAERAQSFHAIYPEAVFETPPAEIESSTPLRSEAILAMLTGWMQHLGPTSAAELAALLGLSESDVDQALLRLESTGAILRGNFTGAATASGQPAVEWCERRLLARIHRLTLGALRREIEPVTQAQFMRWLLRWQHVAPGAQTHGERGTLEILRQLQGFEIPANAWERQVLARRVSDYDPKVLDQLCLTGAVGWGRLSPHPATLEYSESPDRAPRQRRVIPTSVAPITFFVREEADWMQPRRPEATEAEERGLSPGARDVLNFLRQRGASFFADIVRGTDKLKAEIETGLWELVAGGLVTADGFDNLRSLIDPKRRAGQGSGRAARPRHAAGRWSLLFPVEAAEKNKAIEATSRMLLNRYGVVFRDLLAREAIEFKWRELLLAFRRMEDRGDVRGGRFVSGFIGEQFALPVAVESVRAMRKQEPSGEVVTISAADPLNLVGIVVPGERVPAISGKTVSFRDGVAIPPEEAAVKIAAWQ